MTAKETLIPHDADVAARARARMCLDRVLETSPVRLVGKDTLRRLANELDARRARSKPTVTPSRLGFGLRHACWFAVNSIGATQIPLGKMADSVYSHPDATNLPNAVAKKAALRKLDQAKKALERVVAHLSADVVLAFGSVDEHAFDPVRNELSRLEGSIAVPLHFHRGKPVLASLIEFLHSMVFFDLTGKWQRSWGKADAPDDGFITDFLHEMARAILPQTVSDNDIGMCIETAIRKVRA